MDATKRPLSIACGSSCNAKRWTNKQMTWDEYCEKMKTPTRTPETAEEYRAMSKSDRDKAKDCGGYVFGYLKDNRRRKARCVLPHRAEGGVCYNYMENVSFPYT